MSEDESFYIGKISARMDEILLGHRLVAFEPYVGAPKGELDAWLRSWDVGGYPIASLVTERGTWVYSRGLLGFTLVRYLKDHLDTSGSVSGDSVLDHWIAGMAFGYDLREVEKWIKTRMNLT